MTNLIRRGNATRRIIYLWRILNNNDYNTLQSCSLHIHQYAALNWSAEMKLVLFAWDINLEQIYRFNTRKTIKQMQQWKFPPTTAYRVTAPVIVTCKIYIYYRHLVYSGAEVNGLSSTPYGTLRLFDIVTSCFFVCFRRKRSRTKLGRTIIILSWSYVGWNWRWHPMQAPSKS